MTNEELLAEIRVQQELMIAVATKELRIEDVDGAYTARRSRIRQALTERGLRDPNPHADLWRWYAKWKDHLPRYNDRRVYVGQLYDELREHLESGVPSHPGGTAVADVDPFGALQQQVTEQQRDLLTTVFSRFLTTNEWILARVLHAGGKASIRPALEDLGSAVVFEEGYPPEARYQLTLLGMLLSDHGNDVEALLSRYLEHIRDAYLANASVSEFRSGEVQHDLDLSDEQTRLLGFLVSLGQFSYGGSGFGTPQWTANIPGDIDDFPGITNFLPYIHARAMQFYAPRIPLDAVGRQQHRANAQHAAAQAHQPQPTQQAPADPAPATCFVLMPFGDPFDGYYQRVIRPAIKAAGLSAVRGDDITKPGSITQQIWRELQRARLCLAELTGLNANVMYELGLAHALHKPVVQITQDVQSLPFDLRDQRHVGYRTSDPTWAAKLRRDTTTMLTMVLADPRGTLVFNREKLSTHDESELGRAVEAHLTRKMRSYGG